MLCQVNLAPVNYDRYSISLSPLTLCHAGMVRRQAQTSGQCTDAARNSEEAAQLPLPNLIPSSPSLSSSLTTDGRSRSSQRANCLSLALPALSSLLSLLLRPLQQALHLSSLPAQPSSGPSGEAARRLSHQSSRHVTLATKTRRTRTKCLPRRSSRRSRSCSAAPATT